VSKVDVRFIAGTGTLLAAIAIFMFSRMTVDDSAGHVLGQLQNNATVGAGFNYWAHAFPYILMMSFGMGLTFVTLTQTAVHHIRQEDSGVASGVLNTMQQVGGSLGLAALSTVSLHFVNQRAADVGPAIAQGLGGAANQPAPGGAMSNLQYAMQQATFTHGASHAFVVGSIMMLIASAIIWLFVDVSHKELATDGPAPAPAH
jgi:hypothetical protein